MSKLEDWDAKDDWKLARHLDSFNLGEGGRVSHDETEVREHLKQARRYNGWSNYETWSVHLVLSNEQGLAANVTQVVVDAMETEPDPELRVPAAADALANWVSDEFLGDTQEHLSNDSEADRLASQLVSAALSEVDWFEVAKAFAPEPVASVGKS